MIEDYDNVDYEYFKEWDLEQAKKEIERLNNIIDKKEQLLGDNIKRLEREVVKRDNIINELEKWLEEEQDRLARETSNIYEDSLGKTRLVNENIYEEVQKTKDKLQELKGFKKKIKR